MSEEITVGEKIARELEKISKALENIPSQGFTRQLLILYIKEKTGLGKGKIEAVLDAIHEFSREMGKELNRGE